MNNNNPNPPTKIPSLQHVAKVRLANYYQFNTARVCPGGARK